MEGHQHGWAGSSMHPPAEVDGIGLVWPGARDSFGGTYQQYSPLLSMRNISRSFRRAFCSGIWQGVRGKGHILQQERFRLDIRKNMFTMRTVK